MVTDNEKRSTNRLCVLSLETLATHTDGQIKITRTTIKAIYWDIPLDLLNRAVNVQETHV